MPEQDPAVRAAIEGELRLLDPDVRRSPERLGALLHPEFHEFGSSGRRWDRASTLARLPEDTDSADRYVVTSGIEGVRLAPDVVHLTFDTVHAGRHAHRSSLWRRTDAGWQMYFHQGTPFPAEGE
ncbi:nuclear transport factor 2 family protein [Streptomyces chartreusis]|uniref:nuclear transport factor 2 family protein n=1 Tax=Streptomyces TaxID=1883 RepID=UPI002E80DE9F|nr:nuclear transport factor 2 family protein [Streptomyces chartreusis]WSZ66153.1 nuclear transport factor 2 family protein [Streptomyces chartreusis]WTA30999.1 nuclear transport factor 2 family protein [Streptomyces chartreusis]WUB21483.1 nuclear transport factor 2 family protein [Streptomyces chartreusis]